VALLKQQNGGLQHVTTFCRGNLPIVPLQGLAENGFHNEPLGWRRTVR